MTRPVLVGTLILGGLCLLILGLGWNHLVPSAKEMAIARERFKKISQQLERARGSQSRIGTLFLVAGVSLLLVGIVLHFSQNRSE